MTAIEPPHKPSISTGRTYHIIRKIIVNSPDIIPYINNISSNIAHYCPLLIYGKKFQKLLRTKIKIVFA